VNGAHLRTHSGQESHRRVAETNFILFSEKREARDLLKSMILASGGIRANCVGSLADLKRLKVPPGDTLLICFSPSGDDPHVLSDIDDWCFEHEINA
jgi:hypothetical protein